MTIMTTTDVRRLSRLRTWCRTGRAREIRVRAHLTQDNLANAIGTTQSAVQAWETGIRSPRNNDTARRYLDLLETLQLDAVTR